MFAVRSAPGLRQISRNYSATSTLSEDELQKFSLLASKWWDVNGPLKGLHSLNKLRVPFVRNGICSYQKSAVKDATPVSPLAGCTILDVGCGGGILSESLARLGAHVTAIDPSETNIAAASLRAQKMKLDNLVYKTSTIENLQSSDPSSPMFDVITASEVIEHVENPEYFTQKCTELLKPGGSLFITTLNRSTASWVLGICAAEYLMKIVPQGTHDWNKFITPDEMISYLSKNGCQIRQLYGMSYNPFNNKWNWSKFTTINYALHATKLQPEKATEITKDENEPTHSNISQSGL